MPVNDNQSDNNAFAVMIENKHHEWTVFICHLLMKGYDLDGIDWAFMKHVKMSNDFLSNLIGINHCSTKSRIRPRDKDEMNAALNPLKAMSKAQDDIGLCF